MWRLSTLSPFWLKRGCSAEFPLLFSRPMVDESGLEWIDVVVDLLFLAILSLLCTLGIKFIIKILAKRSTSVVAQAPTSCEEVVLPSGQKVYLRHG